MTYSDVIISDYEPKISKCVLKNVSQNRGHEVGENGVCGHYFFTRCLHFPKKVLNAVDPLYVEPYLLQVVNESKGKVFLAVKLTEN